MFFVVVRSSYDLSQLVQFQIKQYVECLRSFYDRRSPFTSLLRKCCVRPTLFVYLLSKIYSTYCNFYVTIEVLGTGWTVRGSNPGGREIFRTRPDWSWGTPSLL